MRKTLYLIVARGGSKGVVGKNMKKLADLSLIGWKALSARNCDPTGRLVISTDCPKIAAEARSHGVEVPFMRPAELATDTASTSSVIKHALENLPGYDRVMLLEPSSPFTTDAQMRGALEMMHDLDADLIVGMREVQPHRVFVAEKPKDNAISGIIAQMSSAGENLRRQDLGTDWTMNGGLYLFKTEMFLRTGSIYGSPKSYGLLMDRWHSIEIDFPEDMDLAEYAVRWTYVGVPRPVREVYPVVGSIAPSELAGSAQ